MGHFFHGVKHILVSNKGQSRGLTGCRRSGIVHLYPVDNEAITIYSVLNLGHNNRPYPVISPLYVELLAPRHDVAGYAYLLGLRRIDTQDYGSIAQLAHRLERVIGRRNAVPLR